MTNKLIASICFIVVSVGCDGPDRADNGGACVEDNSCNSGLCVEAFGNGTVVEGGLCTQECEWTGGLMDDCPEEEVCLRYNATGEKLCFLECETDDDCRSDEGWVCQFVGDGYSACIPPL